MPCVDSEMNGETADALAGQQLVEIERLQAAEAERPT